MSGARFCACLALTVGDASLAYGGGGDAFPDPAGIGKSCIGFILSRTQNLVTLLDSSNISKSCCNVSVGLN